MNRNRQRENNLLEAIDHRLFFQEDLRSFAEAQALKLNQPASKLLSEAAISELLDRRPRSISAIREMNSDRGDLPEAFYLSLLATCIEEYEPEPVPFASSLIGPGQGAAKHITISSPVSEVFTRPRSTTQESESLTPAQQALDQRLRAWRQAESERLNLPLFFVLASTTLRNIVLARPQNLSQLGSIQGLGHDKIEKFGPRILEICTD